MRFGEGKATENSSGKRQLVGREGRQKWEEPVMVFSSQTLDSTP